MALTTTVVRGTSLTFRRGTNDVETVYLGDKPFGKKGNGSVASFASQGAAETAATGIAALCDAAVTAISGAFSSKDPEAVIPADDGTSVSGMFTVIQTDVSKKATCPNISIYVPKILKATKIADMAALLKNLNWKSVAGVDYGVTVQVKYSALV